MAYLFGLAFAALLSIQSPNESRCDEIRSMLKRLGHTEDLGGGRRRYTGAPDSQIVAAQRVLAELDFEIGLMTRLRSDAGRLPSANSDIEKTVRLALDQAKRERGSLQEEVRNWLRSRPQAGTFDFDQRDALQRSIDPVIGALQRRRADAAEAESRIARTINLFEEQAQAAKCPEVAPGPVTPPASPGSTASTAATTASTPAPVAAADVAWWLGSWRTDWPKGTMTLELHRDASEVRGALARKGPLGYAIACPPAAAILRGALTTVETALEIGLPQGFAGDVVGCATATVFEGRYNNQQRLRAGAVSGDIRIGVFRVERTAEGFKGEISRWDPYAQLIGRDFTWRGAR